MIEDEHWYTVLVEVLQRLKQAQPDELADVVTTTAHQIGLEVTIYLVDHEQRRLHPVPIEGTPASSPLSISGTVAGRAYQTVRTQAVGGSDGTQLWVPMIDGSERLGVVEVIAPAPNQPERFQRQCETLVGLIGHLITVKMPYGDGLHRVRRTRPMSAASELILQMLPPLTFSCQRTVVSATLEPCYDVGGDAFDYAIDGPNARVMVLDAMGRGLQAAITCATALAALRAARREGRDSADMASAADQHLNEQFSEVRFVTGILADLDLTTGQLRFVNAGHPPPLLLRRGRAVRQLAGGRRMPLGLPDTVAEFGQESLEPGDWLLLYTDGVVDAHHPGGEIFGVDRLVDLAEQCAANDLPAPETLRRLSHAVIDHQAGPPKDDATLLMVEWSRDAAARAVV
jgi:sigma-B regulation protein RsbU (phosphoserine phosphatase)